MDTRQKSELTQSANYAKERAQQILGMSDGLNLTEFEKKFADKTVTEGVSFDFKDPDRKTKGWVRVTYFERSVIDE